MSWYPSEKYYSWDPPAWRGNGVEVPITTLLKASPAYFEKVESALRTMALYAEVTASGLVKAAEAPDWYGPAADAYRGSIGGLPKTLYAAHDAHLIALRAFTAFAESTYSLQASMRAAVAQKDHMMKVWNDALETDYGSEAHGAPILDRLETEFNAAWAAINQILDRNDDALTTLLNALKPATALAPTVPGPSTLDRIKGIILTPIEDLISTVGSTGSRIYDFFTDPSWQTFGDMTESLSLDAGLIALAAAGGEGLAGVTLADGAADSGVAEFSGLLKDIASGASVGLYGTNVAADVAQGRYGSAALKSLLVLAPDSKELLSTTELDAASADSALLANYRSALDEGKGADWALKQLDPDDAARVKALVKDYRDPAAVDSVRGDVANDLKAARVTALKEQTSDNVDEHGLRDPVIKMGGNAVDGPPSTEGDTTGVDPTQQSGPPTCGPPPPVGLEPGPTGLSS